MAEAQGGPLETVHLGQRQISQQAQRHRNILPQVPIGVGKRKGDTLAHQWDYRRRGLA